MTDMSGDARINPRDPNSLGNTLRRVLSDHERRIGELEVVEIGAGVLQITQIIESGEVEINAATISHDALADLNTQSHDKYLTLDGSRIMSGPLKVYLADPDDHAISIYGAPSQSNWLIVVRPYSGAVPPYIWVEGTQGILNADRTYLHKPDTSGATDGRTNDAWTLLVETVYENAAGGVAYSAGFSLDDNKQGAATSTQNVRIEFNRESTASGQSSGFDAALVLAENNIDSNLTANFYQVVLEGPAIGGGVSVSNFYHLRIQDTSSGTISGNHYGLYIESLNSAAGNEYAIYTNDGYVYFGDHTAIGADAAPSASTILQVQNTLTDTAAQIDRGVQGYLEADPAGASATRFVGVEGIADQDASNAQNFTNSEGGVQGGRFIAFTRSSGTTTKSLGLYVRNRNLGSGTITTQTGVRIEAPTNAGTVTTSIGLEIGSVTVGTNNWAILTGEGLVQFGDTTHIFQTDASGAAEVLKLDQADVDEPFIKFVGDAAAADLTRNIVAVGDVSTATLAGYVKVEVQDDGNQITDQDYYMPIYTLA